MSQLSQKATREDLQRENFIHDKLLRQFLFGPTEEFQGGPIIQDETHPEFEISTVKVPSILFPREECGLGQYPKTVNVFTRDPDTHKLTRQLSDPAHDQIRTWLATEKINGTNVRLIHDPLLGGAIRGRTDKADMFPGVEEAIQDRVNRKFPDGYAFRQLYELLGWTDDLVMTIFGEAYGPGIQKGGAYRLEGKNFRVFDVATQKKIWEDENPRLGRSYWHDWATVYKVARFLGLDLAPVFISESGVLSHFLENLVTQVQEGIPSLVSRRDGGNPNLLMEGLVARTDPYLFNADGSRVVLKIKTKDLQ